MPEGYCVKERKKVEIKDAKQVTMKNGRPAIQGVCPDCGTKIFKIGKREAYAAHSGELYGFAVRSLGDAGLAEEAVQETFLRAWKAGERYDPEIGSLRTWLFAILRNVVIDLGRAGGAAPRVAEGGVEPSVEPLEQALLAWQVEEAMRRIGEGHSRGV